MCFSECRLSLCVEQTSRFSDLAAQWEVVPHAIVQRQLPSRPCVMCPVSRCSPCQQGQHMSKLAGRGAGKKIPFKKVIRKFITWLHGGLKWSSNKAARSAEVSDWASSSHIKGRSGRGQRLETLGLCHTERLNIKRWAKTVLGKCKNTQKKGAVAMFVLVQVEF
jgi:hypothetical protein